MSINFCWGVTGDPVQQHTGKSPLEEDGNSLDQMTHLLSLLLSSMASQSTAKLAKLLQSNLVPAPKRLRHYGDELNPLLPAQFLGVSALVVEGHRHRMTRIGGCSSSCGILERVRYGHVQGGIKPSCPVGEENIGWPTVVARKEGTPLSQGSKASSSRSVKDGVAHCIVPDDAFSTCSTDQAVVAKYITLSATVWAGARLVVYRQAKPKLAGNHKLCTSQVKTKGRQGSAV